MWSEIWTLAMGKDVKARIQLYIENFIPTKFASVVWDDPRYT